MAVTYTVSGQRSGICHAAYGRIYGYPTRDLEEARISAQHSADIWQEDVVLIQDGRGVIERFQPKRTEG